MEGIKIRTEVKPGDLGAITLMHELAYAREHGFDKSFSPYVARPLSEFILADYPKSRLWVVEKEGVLSGSIAIAKVDDYLAQLRWFLLDPSLRGLGLGKKLVGEAVDFSRKNDYKKVILWTVQGMETAIELYKRAGFKLAEENQHNIWGKDLTEQKYELDL